jgi:hypothetical protein
MIRQSVKDKLAQNPNLMAANGFSLAKRQGLMLSLGGDAVVIQMNQ